MWLQCVFLDYGYHLVCVEIRFENFQLWMDFQPVIKTVCDNEVSSVMHVVYVCMHVFNWKSEKNVWAVILIWMCSSPVCYFFSGFLMSWIFCSVYRNLFVLGINKIEFYESLKSIDFRYYNFWQIMYLVFLFQGGGVSCDKPFWILELFDCYQDVKFN